MAQSKSMALRLSIVEAHRRGKTLQETAAEHGVSYATAQSLCARYRSSGEAGLRPRYDNCGKQGPDPRKDFVYRAVRCYKTWHGAWGAEKIRTEMLLLRPDLKVPSVRTLQKWFERNRQNRKRERQPREVRQWAKAAHDVWQVDAKEEMQTRDGEKNCWLNIKDEHSGAVIEPSVFPPQKNLRGAAV